MNKLRLILPLLILTVLSISVFAQTDNKDVSITSSGSGKTLEEAKQAALRSATEQAFGAFISTKTEMFNDQIVADQFSSVSSGNIKSYEVLNEDQLPDGRWGVTLKTIVSIDKLTSFVEAKGITVEMKGGLFALNIKQQLLNEEGELNTINELIGILHESLQLSFDYTLKSSNPKSLDAESKNWEIPLEITAKSNKNIDFCANYLAKTLTALSLKKDELESYNSLKKEIFTISINHNGNSKIIHLRKQGSIDALNSLTRNWEFYIRNFAVNSGTELLIGKGTITDIHKFATFENERNYEWHYETLKKLIITFPNQGNIVGLFSYNDKKTLSQIERMTGYSIKPRGVVSGINHGGYVLAEAIEGGFKVGLDIDQNKKVSFVSDQFPAYYDFKVGDEILSINGTPYEDINQLRSATALLKYPKGGTINISIKRGKDVLKIKTFPRYIQPRKGLVLAIYDIRNLKKGEYSLQLGDWNNAKKIAENLSLNGYNDWRLPSKNELQFIYDKCYKIGLGGLMENTGYASGEGWDDTLSKKAYYLSLREGENEIKIGQQASYFPYLRFVRNF